MLDAPMDREPNESTPLPRPPRTHAPSVPPSVPPRERARIEQQLRAQRIELLEGIAWREANPTHVASEEPSSLAILRGELAKTTRALDRLADGTYGICEKCGGPIALSRLRVIPSATRCDRCPASPTSGHNPVH